MRRTFPTARGARGVQTLRYLLDRGGTLARSTTRRHLNNLFLLGGELIRRINTYEEDRRLSLKRLLDDSLDEQGGPLCRHAERGSDLRHYDATCKKLYTFRSARSRAHKFREEPKIRRAPSFRNLSFASGLHALVAYGLQYYYSPFLMRSHNMSITETSTALAAITVIGGIAGTFLGGKLSDFFAQRNGGDPRYQMWVPGVALLINISCRLAALLLPDRYVVMALMIPSIALGATYLGPSISATHQLVGVRERAVSGALLLFVLNIIGIGLGPILSGFISDVFALCISDSTCSAEPLLHISGALMSKFAGNKSHDEHAIADGLKYALCIMSVANLWSAFHYFRAAKTLREDMAHA